MDIRLPISVSWLRAVGAGLNWRERRPSIAHTETDCRAICVRLIIGCFMAPAESWIIVSGFSTSREYEAEGRSEPSSVHCTVPSDT